MDQALLNMSFYLVTTRRYLDRSHDYDTEMY